MTKIKPKQDVKWDYYNLGPKNCQWIRLYIFFKSGDWSEYERDRKEILHSFSEIIRKVKKDGILKSFHFLYELFPPEFQKYYSKDLVTFEYFPGMLDMRIWIKKKGSIIENIKKVREIIKNELEIKDDTVDYGYWYFPKKHPQYCNDSKLYYHLICKIYELYCQFLFKKLDIDSTKTVRYEKLGYGNSKNILSGEFDLDYFNEKTDIGNFNNWKIIHCLLNSQGMNTLMETYFGIFYAHLWLNELENISHDSKYKEVDSKLIEALQKLMSFDFPKNISRNGTLNKSLNFVNDFWYFPLQIKEEQIDERKKIFKVIGHWQDENKPNYTTLK